MIVGFGEPMGKRYFGAIAAALERIESVFETAFHQKKVEIFGIARNAGKIFLREGAAYQDWNLRCFQSIEGVTVKVASCFW
jgi:hypothetical protein